MNISVIIPTYNNARSLSKCLECLNKQNFNERFEVIVVDDGSADNTLDVVSEFQNRDAIFDLKYFFQENKKQGAARNLGAKNASGDLLIFIGADILVTENWLAEHNKFHEKFPSENIIALGFMTFTPELIKDRFRKWLEDSGTILSFKGLKNYEQTDFWHFYTGNISMKKKYFLQYMFDEGFKAYGWEDIMLGYRMMSEGAFLYYLENAVAYHNHELAYQDFFPHRMIEIGKSACIFDKKFPNSNVIPSGIKYILLRILSLQIVVFVLGLFKKEWRWYVESKRYFLRGVKIGKNSLKKVLIIGSYGASNIGDEEMIDVILEKLPHEIKKFVLTGDVKDTLARHKFISSASPHLPFGFRSFFSFKWIKSFYLLWKSDLVIVGGGGLFTQSFSSYSILLWSWHVFWASLFGKRIVFLGISVGVLKSKILKHVALWALNRGEKIYLRDSLSYEYLSEYLYKSKISLGSDLTFCRNFQINKEFEKKKIVALNFREFDMDFSIFRFFINYCNKCGYKVLLCALEERDVIIMSEFADEETGVAFFKNLDELKNVLLDCEFAVGMRLHFLISAAIARCKVFGLSYDPKVKGLLNDMDVSYFNIDDLSEEKMKEILRLAEESNNLSELHEKSCSIFEQLKKDMF
ncbi:MAG: glycosyltransferase [Candidatus Gracilibacteria bacterium]|jgi:polysaccharide pyruvyl transferase CsaB